MRKIKKVILLIVVFMIAVSIKGNTAFAKYVIQVVPTKNYNSKSTVSAWTGINISDAYDACQDLNTDTSSLGHTENLKAHLTTNADWYAVSLLTISSYGNKSAGNTTGNKTGVMNLGTNNLYTYTASVMEGSTTNTDRKSLYDALNANPPSPYVEVFEKKENRSNNLPGRGVLEKELVSTSYGTIRYANDNNYAYPVGIRSNLLGFNINNFSNVSTRSSGASANDVTFRPVIWNK